MRSPEEAANINVNAAVKGPQGKENPDVRLKILTSRLSLIRAALLRGTPSFAGVNTQIISEDQRARLRHVADLRVFFEKLAQEVDLTDALGPELNTLAEYDDLTEKLEKQRAKIPSEKAHPKKADPLSKAAPPPKKAKEEKTARPRNEFERMQVIFDQAKAVKQFTREEEIQAFTDYNDLKRDLIDALFKEPDALRAAMLLCMPTSKLYKKYTPNKKHFKDTPNRRYFKLSLKYFAAYLMNPNIDNPFDDFLRHHGIKDVDAMTGDTIQKEDGKSRDRDYEEKELSIAKSMRQFGISFLRSGEEKDREQAVECLAKLNISPAALAFLVRFSKRGEKANVTLAKIIRMHDGIIRDYSLEAAKLARKHMRTGDCALSAYGLALKGISHAIDKFDPDCDVKFWTYSYYWIKAYLKTGLKEERETIHIPADVTDDMRKVTKAQIVSANIRGDAPIEEIARATKMPVEEVEKLVALMRLRYTRSLDAPYSAHDDAPDATTFLERVPDDASKTPEARVAQASSRTLVKYLITHSGLSERERYIIEQRSMSDNPTPLEEVGEHFGLTREGARKIEIRAFGKLRRCVERLDIVPEDVF